MPSTTPKRGFIKPSSGDLISAFQPNIGTALDVIDNMIDDADARLTNQRVPSDTSVTTAKVAPGGLAQSAITNLVTDLAAKVAKAAAADGVRYVSSVGSDTNDGLSTGSSKLTVAAAITALGGAGVVRVAKGTFIGVVDIPTGVIVEGEGPGNTVLSLPNSSNRAVVKTVGFDALTGTDGTGGAMQWGVRRLSIDGNKTNQSSGACWGVRSYGLDFMISEVNVRNCRTGGIYSEWSTTPTASGDSMESWLLDVKVHDNDGNGIEWRGPHHSKWVNVLSFSNLDRGVKIAGAGTGIQAVNCHSRGLSQLYAWDIGAAGCQLSNCTGESAISANGYIVADNTSVDGGSWTGSGLTTTLSSGITNSQTSIGVAAGLATSPFEAVIGSEIIKVTAGGDTTTWTIQRAQRGTTAVSHSSGDRVYVGTPYQFQIGDAGTATGTRLACQTLNGRAAVNFANAGWSTVDISNYQTVGASRVGKSIGKVRINNHGGSPSLETIFDVRDYGALGDGVTDDTAAILLAIAAAEVAGGIVYFPTGIYRLTGPITLNPNGDIAVDYRGDGVWQTVFLLDDVSAAVRISEGGGVTVLGQRGSATGGFRVDCNNIATTGFFVGLTDDRSLYDIWVTNSPGTGCVIEETQNLQVNKLVVDTCAVGVSFDFGADANVFHSIEVVNCGKSVIALNTALTYGCHHNTFIGGLIEYFDADQFRPYETLLEYSNSADSWLFLGVQFVAAIDALPIDAPLIKIRTGSNLQLPQCTLSGAVVGATPVFLGVGIDAISPGGVVAAIVNRTTFFNMDCAYKLGDDTLIEVIGADPTVSVTQRFRNQPAGINTEQNLVQMVRNHTVFHHAPTTTEIVERIEVTGEVGNRFIRYANGVHVWGDGSDNGDVTLYRLSADHLLTDDHFQASDGISTKVKSGVPTDGDFLHAPPNGAIAVDETNNKIYVRIGGTWKGVTVS